MQSFLNPPDGGGGIVDGNPSSAALSGRNCCAAGTGKAVQNDVIGIRGSFDNHPDHIEVLFGGIVGIAGVLEIPPDILSLFAFLSTGIGVYLFPGIAGRGGI